MAITGPCTANRTCDWLEHYGWNVVDHPQCSPGLVPSVRHSFGFLSRTWLMIDLHQTQTRSRLSFPSYRFILRRNKKKKLGAAVRQTLKCQWWLRESLMCTICYPSAKYTSTQGSQNKVLGMRVFVVNSCFF